MRVGSPVLSGALFGGLLGLVHGGPLYGCLPVVFHGLDFLHVLGMAFRVLPREALHPAGDFLHVLLGLAADITRLPRICDNLR